MTLTDWQFMSDHLNKIVLILVKGIWTNDPIAGYECDRTNWRIWPTEPTVILSLQAVAVDAQQREARIMSLCEQASFDKDPFLKVR